MSDVQSTLGEARRLLSFLIVGAAATAIHVGLVVLLVETGSTRPTMANCLAFVVANVSAYFANSYVTFEKSPRLQGYFRYLAVSLVTLSIVLMISFIGERLNIDYLISLGIIILVIPLCSYLLMRWFAFPK